jgi:hypothetical protein
MPMRKYLVGILLMLISTGNLIAQKVDLIKKGIVATKSSNSFEFIESATNLTSASFIGTIRAVGIEKDSAIPKLFFKLRNKGLELGANGFKLNKFEKSDNSQNTSLILDVYYCSDSLLEKNRSSHFKNSVILFLDDLNSDEIYEFYINEIERKIKSGTYFRYNIKSGTDFVLTQSGWFGSTYKYRWKENRHAIFISFTDYGLEGKENETDYLGMYFNTKRINTIDSDLGYLLTVLLPKG